MTYATTFSGGGGWEIGLNACGWYLQWQCECETCFNKRIDREEMDRESRQEKIDLSSMHDDFRRPGDSLQGDY